MQSPDPSVQPPRRKSLLRRILFGILFSLGSVLLLLVVIAAFFDEQVCRQLISEVNKNLKTELKVGKASLSLLSSFPSASIDLSQVRLSDAMGGQLLAAKQLSFRFDMLSLFGDDLKIHSIKLSEGAIRVVVNKAGKSNTDIYKDTAPKKNQPAESGLHLALQNAELNNVTILYDNALTQQAAEFTVDQAGAGGDFSSERFRLSSQADLKIKRIDSDSSRYLAGEKLHYDAVLAVDLKKGVYAIQQLELALGGNTFTVEGLAARKQDATDLKFKLNSQEGDISMLANLLPGAYHDYFSAFQSSGNYSCSGTVEGRLSKTETPAVSFEVALRDGKVSSEMLQGPLRNVSFRAKYKVLPDGSGAFELNDFKGDFGGQTLNMSVKVSHLEDPIVDFQANGILPLDAAYGLFGDEAITGGDGLLRLNRLSVQGRYADMVSMSGVSRVNASGEIQFEKAALTYHQIPVMAETGFLRLQDNEFRLDSFFLRAGNSDFLVNGNAKNLLPVLFADSLNTTDALLEFNAGVRSQNVDVDQLLSLFTVPESAAQGGGEAKLDSLKKENNAERSLNMDKLKGTFEAQFFGFKYGKIEGKNFVGKLGFDHNQLNITGNTYAMQGQILLDGDAQFQTETTLKMRIVAHDIDLQSMLAQSDNFGQEIITDANLRGKLNGRVALWAFWNATGDFDMNRLHALADLRATDGELLNVKMFEDFSTYIHIEDLRRVKFTDMQEFMEIKNRQLLLPVMSIRSNALNLTLTGKHSFDNAIDYKMKINAGQVLLNRIKKHDADLDPLPEKKGGFNLFYSITGTVDKYDMKRRKKTVKEEFERSESQKALIAKALSDEFDNTALNGAYASPEIE